MTARHPSLLSGAGLLTAGLLLVGCAGPQLQAQTSASGTSASPAAQTAQATVPTAAGSASSASEDAPATLIRYPSYTTADQMREAAEMVVVGRVVSAREEEGDLMAEPGAVPNPQDPEPLILPSTVYTVEITSVLSGRATPGHTVQVRVLDGTQDGQSAVLPAVPELSVGSGRLYLFHLVQGGTHLTPINPQEGVLALEGDHVRALGETALPAAELERLTAAVAQAG
ncbi:hypothetical protein [Micrococcus sp.]|uniref:hypothetical protein n=1 Tax=Micrococcus sp. TaxID=1271 RepID=UPI002A91BB1D|nr:hypothetical protein [Micrococcus sp.]MDY6056010.1 hypothetical protein [Micrococcus sp.]